MIEWFARNSVAANLLMMCVVIAGLASIFSDITVETFPESEPDRVTASVALRGATPEDMELGVTVRVEEAVAGLEGIEKITSVSREGSATITMRIDDDYDRREVLDDIKSRIDAINTFPVDAEKPVVAISERTRPVIRVVVAGDFSEQEIRRYTEKVRDDLLRYENITNARLAFNRGYEIAIEASQDQLRKFGLSLSDIANAVRESSLDISAGNLRSEGGDVLIRSKGQAYNKEEFESIVVKSSSDGSIIRVADVATVFDGFQEDSDSALFNGRAVGMVRVYRVGDQGVIGIADTVKEYIEEQQSQLPVGMEISYWNDSSEFLKQRLSTLIWNMVSGGVLVILLLALFLRPAVAFWVFIGIPISFVGSFTVLKLFDIPINTMSLFGYIIVLGIVVDDAIVTGESIYSRMRKSNSGIEAAISGTKRVAVPVTFGVVTTMAAFFPMFFLDGIFARFLAPIPPVVIAVLLFSLIESKFVLPAHLKHLKVNATDDELTGFSRWQQNFADRFERLIVERYKPVLALCVRNRYTVVITFFCGIIVIFAMFFSGHARFQIFPRIPSETIIFTVEMPVGTPFNITDHNVQNITSVANQLRDKYVTADGEAALTNILSVSGAGSGQANPSRGVIFVQVELDTLEKLGITAELLTREWRRDVGDLVGVESISIRSESFRVGDPVDVQLSGNSFEDLSAAADEIKAHLRTYDYVFEVSDTFSDGKEELRVDLTPQGQVLGLTRSDILGQVSQAFRGFEAQRIQRGRDDIRVIVRLPKEERSTAATLDELLIDTASGQQVPLSQVARITPNRGPAAIRHVDRYRVVNVTADYDKEKTNSVALNADLNLFLDGLMAKYPGVGYKLKGEAEEQAKTLGSLGLSIIILLFVIYCLLALPLKSYIQPIVVMFVIPFSIIGAVLGHVLMGEIITVLSLLGVLALIGVVVNDSLVLVDYVNQQRAGGASTMDSVLNAGTARFRAVMLTSLTTFLGLFPLMFASSLQSAFLVPMAISLGYGILFGTLITLVLVPSSLLIVEDLRKVFGLKPSNPLAQISV